MKATEFHIPNFFKKPIGDIPTSRALFFNQNSKMGIILCFALKIPDQAFHDPLTFMDTWNRFLKADLTTSSFVLRKTRSLGAKTSWL